MTSRLDTLVIGAGAAGLACARRLFEAGQTVRVLEARDRIGGRIHTDTTFTGYPLELGAEFIHGERVVTHDLLRAAGLSVIPVDRLGAGLRWGSPAVPLNQIAPETRSTIEQLRAAYAALVGRDPALPDRALADYLRECGFAPGALRIADVLLAQTCCAPLDDLSCADLARELRVDHAGPLEFRIAEGYAPLLNWLACDLPLTLGSPVSQIHWGAHGVTVEANGAEFTAHRAVITLPVAVLASGAVTFDPPLPRLKQDALAALPTEPATKLIYRFAERRWDTDLTFMAHEGIAARWWTPGYRRAGPPVLAAYVTAGRARQVDALPEAEALALGLRDAAALLGQPELASLVTGARRVSWAADPWARGGYAHVRSGGAEARPALAMPLEGSLFFAGEATAHDSNPQTVHGAIESGWRAAREILAG